MTWRRLRFLLLCAVIWPVSILLANRLTEVTLPIVWWLLIKSGGTQLSRPMFTANALVPFALVEGFLLGLLPVASFVHLLAAAFGWLRTKSVVDTEQTNQPASPLLWAWVLPAVVFLIRFVTLDTGGRVSVLGGHGYSLSRFAYFFGSVTSLTATSVYAEKWLIDRLLITIPMLFTVAYRLGAWAYQQHRRRRLTEVTMTDEASLPSATDTLGS